MVPKPSWFREPPKFEFRPIHDPLMAAATKITNLLNDPPKSHTPIYWFIVRAIVMSAFDSYKGTLLLLKSDNKEYFPVPASAIVRTMLEGLVNIVALGEDPAKRTIHFRKDGWSTWAKQYYREVKSWGHLAEEKPRLAAFRAHMDGEAKELGITAAEVAKPDIIPPWPTPHKMVRRKFVSGDRKDFVEELLTWYYGDQSAMVHVRARNVMMQAFTKDPKAQWSPGKVESDTMVEAMIFLTATLSEADVLGGLGAHQQLRYIWTLLGSFIGAAKEMYDGRYTKVLAAT